MLMEPKYGPPDGSPPGQYTSRADLAAKAPFPVWPSLDPVMRRVAQRAMWGIGAVLEAITEFLDDHECPVATRDEIVDACRLWFEGVQIEYAGRLIHRDVVLSA